MFEPLSIHTSEKGGQLRNAFARQHNILSGDNGSHDLWRYLVCLLCPTLLHGFIDSPPTSLQPERTKPQLRSAVGPEHFIASETTKPQDKGSPTPSSSRARHSKSPTHTTRSVVTNRSPKRRLDSELGEDAVLINKRTERSDAVAALSYKLVLVQQPTTGSAFEDNLLGRIGLAPPLIVELQVFQDGRSQDASAELPFLICQCSLLDEDGKVADMVEQKARVSGQSSSQVASAAVSKKARGGRHSAGLRGSLAVGRSLDSTEASASSASEDLSTPGTRETSSTLPTSGQTSPQVARMLYGTLAAGPQQYNSPEGEEDKAYFFFPEISIRTPGRFKIRCTLLRLSLPGIDAPEVGSLAQVETKAFEVVNRTQYSAPYITDISRHFARQGVPLLLPPGVSAE